MNIALFDFVTQMSTDIEVTSVSVKRDFPYDIIQRQEKEKGLMIKKIF